MTGRRGRTYRLTDRQQRKLKNRLEVVEKLKTVAREDQALEGLIYQMQYAEALNAARQALGVAEEMQDAQGTVTYQAYIERIERIIDDSKT